MDFEPAALPALILIILSSVLLLLITDWRFSLVALALQYVGAFLLVAVSWPLAMAVSQLVAGWMAAAVLGMAMLGLQGLTGSEARSARKAAGMQRNAIGRLRIRPELVFQLAAATLILLTISILAGKLVAVLGGIRLEIIWGFLALAGMGFLKMGFNSKPFPSAMGLLTFLTGFIILYASLETSALVAGLLGVITLGLALVAAYLVNAPTMEEEG
jgi:hypothetical protein